MTNESARDRRVGVGVERILVALVASTIGATLLFSVFRGLGAPSVFAIGVAAILGLGATLSFARRLPSSLAGVSRRAPARAALWLILGVASIVVTARLTTFMIDESRASASMMPFDEFFVHHSCMSSYYQGARLQRQGVPNVYERTQYEGPQGEPHYIGQLVIDPFQYPPTFLLFPRLGLLFSENFQAWRSVWFGLEGLIVAAALLAVAVWVGGNRGLRVGLLSLLVWLSMPTLTTLQFGNFHLATVAVAVLSMIAFERGRNAVGGALLAFVMVSKLFPGVLLLYLLFRRRWRSAAWTAAFCTLFVVAAVGLLGWAPFAAFFSYQVPRLASGAAFETIFMHPDAVACSHAVFAIVQKLGLIGVPGMSLALASAVAGVYSIVLIGLSYLASRVGEDRLTKTLVWIALIQLASLRSPFSPDTYAQFAPLWIVSLLLASGARRGWIAVLGVAVLLLNYMTPTQPLLGIRVLATLTLLHQLLFMSLCIWIVSRRPTDIGVEAAFLPQPNEQG